MDSEPATVEQLRAAPSFRSSRTDSDSTNDGGAVAAATRSSIAAQAFPTHRVAHSFSAMPEDSSQLSLQAGDEVRVQCRDASGWTYGRLERTVSSGPEAQQLVGSAGWFPDALLGEETVLSQVRRAEQEGLADGLQNVSAGRGSNEEPRGGAGQRSSAWEAAGQSPLVREAAEQPARGAALEPEAASSSKPKPGAIPQQIAAQEDAELIGTEEVKLQQFEQRLASLARSRRTKLTACEAAERGMMEAETAVETAERLLASLEEQERRCHTEAPCLQGSLRQNFESRLRLLEAKKEVAAATLRSAREKFVAERQSVDSARQRLKEDQAAASSVREAVARERAKAKVMPAPEDPRRGSVALEDSRQGSPGLPDDARRGSVGTPVSARSPRALATQETPAVLAGPASPGASTPSAATVPEREEQAPPRRRPSEQMWEPAVPFAGDEPRGAAARRPEDRGARSPRVPLQPAPKRSSRTGSSVSPAPADRTRQPRPATVQRARGVAAPPPPAGGRGAAGGGASTPERAGPHESPPGARSATPQSSRRGRLPVNTSASEPRAPSVDRQRRAPARAPSVERSRSQDPRPRPGQSPSRRPPQGGASGATSRADAGRQRSNGTAGVPGRIAGATAGQQGAGPEAPGRAAGVAARKQSVGRNGRQEIAAPPEGSMQGMAWPAGTTEAELKEALDVLQMAEALQAKLAAMPTKLREPLLRRCSALQGLLSGSWAALCEDPPEDGGADPLPERPEELR